MTNQIVEKITPVILSGGLGTRLWPLSRQAKPKQFLSFDTEKSLLQETIERLNNIQTNIPYVICNEEHRFLVAEQLRQIKKKSVILLEPFAKNTAPAIALAAFKAIENKQNPILLVLSADHIIQNINAFHHAIHEGKSLAMQGFMVTLGVIPHTPETGYGYIEKGEKITQSAFQVKKFIEKPNLIKAQEYVDSKNYCWNSGMFMFSARTYLQELKQFFPEIYTTCKLSIEKQTVDLDFIRIDRTQFANCPSESIDYAIMEKTTKAVMVSLDANWTDIGSWKALWEIMPKDHEKNSLRGDVFVKETKNSLIYSTDRLVVTLGVNDLVIVETSDAVLVADKNRIQEIKNIVKELKLANRDEAVNHRETQRPWGSFDRIDAGERYQVKRITVNPGEKLSLQLHHHRAEHWVVVKGTAKIRNGENEYFLTENESTFIPVGQIHSLENSGKLPLEIIEVQSGSYLGEDDIIRLEDHYGRDEGLI